MQNKQERIDVDELVIRLQDLFLSYSRELTLTELIGIVELLKYGLATRQWQRYDDA